MTDQQKTPNPTGSGPTPGSDDAASLIRGRIDELHAKHQNDLDGRAPKQATLLEKFWVHHQHHPDKEAAWNQFYAGLTDHEKHQLWQESQNEHQKHQTAGRPTTTQTGQIDEEVNRLPRTTAEAKKRIINVVIALVAYFFLWAFLQWVIPGGALN